MKFLEEIRQKARVKNFVALTLAGVINAFGITLFLNPVDLYDSGISGTSMLLSQLTPEYLPLSLFLILLNVPLFLYGLKKQGCIFTAYAIYTVAVYAITAWLIISVLPIDVSLASPLAGSDLLLCALFGGLISGIGSGLAIRFGGAMDGIEVLAVIFAKRLGMTVGTFVMGYNLVLYIICGFVLHSWILPLYSIVTYSAAVKTIDFIVEGIDHSMSAMIVTSTPKALCAELSDAFGCGMTVVNATGYYSNTQKTIIYLVINRFEVGKVREIARRIDPQVYITLCDVSDVYGGHGGTMPHDANTVSAPVSE